MHFALAENRDLERQRHPRPPGRAALVARRPSGPTSSVCRRSKPRSISCRSSCATSTATRPTGTASAATPASGCWSRRRWPTASPSRIPAFDFEQRIVRATIPALGGLTVASVYVPNGGKDFEAKLRFLDALDMWALEASREPGPLRHLRRPERRANRSRHPSQGAQAQPDWRPRERTRADRAPAARAASSTSAARSIPTTTTCSRGGRRGAT